MSIIVGLHLVHGKLFDFSCLASLLLGNYLLGENETLHPPWVSFSLLTCKYLSFFGLWCVGHAVLGLMWWISFRPFCWVVELFDFVDLLSIGALGLEVFGRHLWPRVLVKVEQWDMICFFNCRCFTSKNSKLVESSDLSLLMFLHHWMQWFYTLMSFSSWWGGSWRYWTVLLIVIYSCVYFLYLILLFPRTLHQAMFFISLYFPSH